jgi:hypothetical protein
MLDYVRSQLPAIVPMLVVAVVGVFLALDRLKRLGKPAVIALAGCCTLLLATAVFPFLQGYLLTVQLDGRRPLAEVSLWMSLFGILRTGLQASAFALLLVAIFGGGNKPASAHKALEGRADEIES